MLQHQIKLIYSNVTFDSWFCANISVAIAIYIFQSLGFLDYLNLLPFFLLCASGSSCCSNAGGDGDTGTGGTGGTGSTSTPFLYVATKDGFFEMDNDVMFGKPTSRFTSLAEGISKYNAGIVVPDLYKIQKSPYVFDNGTIKLQIREIEPEVSALNNIKLSRIRVKKNENIVTKSDFTGCVSVESWEAVNSASKSTRVYKEKKRGIDLSQKLKFVNGTKNKDNLDKSVLLQGGEALVVEIDNVIDKDQYLLIESWYRDWTLGEIYSESKVKGFVVTPYTKAINSLKKNGFKTLASSTIALLVGYLGFNLSWQQDQDSDNLAVNYGYKVANADTPTTTNRSLEISYIKNGTSTRLDVVEPRYSSPSLVAIKVPAESFDGDKLSLKILATKRHKVSAIALAKAKEINSNQYENLSLESAYHHRDSIDYAGDLSTNSAKFIYTYPSDVVTLTFKAGEFESDSDSRFEYLLSVGGVYAPASQEDQAVVGNWTSKLDDEALNFLSTVYQFNKQV